MELYPVVDRRRKLYLYWKVKWLRRFLCKHFFGWIYSNSSNSFLASIAWRFCIGYSILDSFYYDFRIPYIVKEMIRRLSFYIEI